MLNQEKIVTLICEMGVTENCMQLKIIDCQNKIVTVEINANDYLRIERDFP